MNRPPEYENLIKTRALEPVEPTEGAVAGYLKNAQDYLDVATSLDAARTLQVFTLAYEGYVCVCEPRILHT